MAVFYTSRVCFPSPPFLLAPTEYTYRCMQIHAHAPTRFHIVSGFKRLFGLQKVEPREMLSTQSTLVQYYQHQISFPPR